MIGESYNLGLGLPVEAKLKHDNSSEMDMRDGLGAHFTYRHFFMDKLSLDAEVGAYYRYATFIDDNNSDYFYAIHNFGISGKVAITLQPVRHLAPHSGMGINVACFSSFECNLKRGAYGNDISNIVKVDLDHGFAVTPFITCAYAF